MPYSEDAIKKMLPKVRLIIERRIHSLRISSLFIYILCSYLIILKTYLRKHVAREIHVAVTHFKHLVPMLGKYGKQQINRSHFSLVLNIVNLSIILKSTFKIYIHVFFCVQFTMMEPLNT